MSSCVCESSSTDPEAVWIVPVSHTCLSTLLAVLLLILCVTRFLFVIKTNHHFVREEQVVIEEKREDYYGRNRLFAEREGQERPQKRGFRRLREQSTRSLNDKFSTKIRPLLGLEGLKTK